MIALPPIFGVPGFGLFWLGLALTMIGTQAAATANLWQVQALTDSTVAVGLFSLLQGIAGIGLAPLGGGIADRLDRKRMVQLAQGVCLLASVALTVVSLNGGLSVAWIYGAGTLVAAASAFDQPARRALVPALVPRERLLEAFAVLLPTEQLAHLVGPALAGVLIALLGPGAVYLLDALTYGALVLTLAFVAFRRMERPEPQRLWSSIADGFRYVRGQPLIWQLLSLDFSANFFAAYPVLLPAMARDVFKVGASGYGILAAAPALGAIVGAGALYRLRALRRKGALLLGATMAYAVCALFLGYAPLFTVALALVIGLGFFDVVGVSIRQTVTLVETPDRLRGRVAALNYMVGRGGPRLGQAQMGAVAGALGPSLALGLGSAIALAYACCLALTGTTLRRYRDRG